MSSEALTAGAVARRLGVAVTTLRTWHQRYGLGPSEHVAGQHRRYTAEDLARLEVMRRLTAQGVTPAEAARWARRTGKPTAGPDDPVAAPKPAAPPDPGAPGAAPTPDDDVTQVDGAGPVGRAASGRRADPPPADRAPTGGAPRPGTGRDGGGHTIPVGRAGPPARGLARAAMRLDAAAIREILQRSVAAVGVIATWEDVMVPVLIGIGERHSATRRLVEVEHLLSRGISDVLGAVPRRPSGATARVLLACADEEQHSLALEAVAAALAEAGTACRLLGARVPPAALADAITRTGPAAVVLWSQLPGTADPAQLTAVTTRPHRPLLVMAAGPGWSRATVPADVAVPAGLADAVATIVKAVQDAH